MKIDEYLTLNGITRYEVAKVSGIYASAFQNATNQKLKDVPVKYFQAIGLLLGKTGGQVFDEMSADENTVFNFLAEHQITDKARVSELLDLMKFFEKNDIDVSNVSFNRFENESNSTQEEALQAVDNLIASFKSMKQNFEDGNAPLPE